ncbi:PilW family protein [Saccharophagus degradans]|uniref:PilW family protein n=1 Tax=Saccharophagus degradans TaxID=86304 RepID=A0AAW7XE78_9GAMM|nr:PilW family protein [Saccharophagus degradans]MDO6424684.1 PilW family protein [Saccharophagus degradans]MDO6609017.1 PilW family protein [Saccharophagus degradans]
MKNTSSPFHAQVGLSLIELMVSMLIAAFIFSGVLTVMLSGRNSHVAEQESAVLQENQRFATSLLTRDIRMAGSFGCASLQRVYLANVISSTSLNDGGLIGETAIIGYEGGAGTGGFPDSFRSNAYEGSDALILRYADPDFSVLIKEHVASSARMETYDAHRFNQNDVLMVIDSTCRHAGLFQHTSTAAAEIEHAQSGGNCTTVLFAQDKNISCSSPSCNGNSCDGFTPTSYSSGSEVIKYVANAYYIGPSSVIPGTPALKRQVLSGASTRSEEIAQGVESMELLYGVDSDADGDVDRFVGADQVTNWDTVIAVRFSLVLRSQTEMFDSAQTKTINGVTYNDRFIRQLVSNTVQIRNRGL